MNKTKFAITTVTTSHLKMEEEPTFETPCMSDVPPCPLHVCTQIWRMLQCSFCC